MLKFFFLSFFYRFFCFVVCNLYKRDIHSLLTEMLFGISGSFSRVGVGSGSGCHRNGPCTGQVTCHFRFRKPSTTFHGRQCHFVVANSHQYTAILLFSPSVTSLVMSTTPPSPCCCRYTNHTTLRLTPS